ncbi:MAG: phosphoglycerate kinase [Candidatus Omnitrophica bacterium]|nr:phosphoglycerate kinase [Candidatus Omnitrophota bacterium]
MAKLTISDLSLKDKRLLVRVDFNAPQDKQGNITDDIRIRASLPTIKYALDNGVSKLILMSHLGRPKGEIKDSLKMDKVAARLEALISQPVLKLDDCVGEAVEKAIADSREKVILLENLRFHKEEEKNDSDFAKGLAKLGDLFVNDAFGSAHRAHASTEGVTHHLKSAAGFLLEKEIKYLGDTLANPELPFVVILGGAKVSDKIAVIENLLPKAQKFLIGGGMAYTFLKAVGVEIGKSLLDKERLDFAKNIIDLAKKQNKAIVLPVDHIAATAIDNPGSAQLIKGLNLPSDLMGLDIGPRSIEIFKDELKDAKTMLWNGPLGVSEIEAFSRGTKEIMTYITELDAATILGGGDTAAAASLFGLTDKITHISTGGGASLEYMEGKTLPGIAALSDK